MARSKAADRCPQQVTDIQQALTAEPEQQTAAAPPLLRNVIHGRQGPGKALLTALPCHVTLTPLPARAPSPSGRCRDYAPCGLQSRESLQAKDAPPIRIGCSLGRKAKQTESPKLFATRDRRGETKPAGIGGGGRELAEGVMAAARAVTWPGGPPSHFRSRAFSALAASDGGETPRQQRRWRRLRPLGFTLGCAAAVRSAAEPDPTGRGSRTPGRRL